MWSGARKRRHAYGPAFSDLPVGALPAASGKKIYFSETNVCRIKKGKIAEELGQEQALSARQQLSRPLEVILASAPPPFESLREEFILSRMYFYRYFRPIARSHRATVPMILRISATTWTSHRWVPCNTHEYK